MVSRDEQIIAIGAGLPRTGTLSTRTALGMILGGTCYHMDEIFFADDNEQRDFWYKFDQGQLSHDEIKDFFSKHDYRAGVDYPFACFYKKFLEVYPNAKVILNVRDPVRWYVSVRDTIYMSWVDSKTAPMSWFSSWMLGLPREIERVWFYGPDGVEGADTGVYGAVRAGEAAAVKFFNDWVAEVKRTVPEENLLIFRVADGWEPLCKFLEKPIPSEPFPNVNDTEFQLKKFNSIKVRSWALATTIFAGIAVAGGFLLKASSFRKFLRLPFQTM